MVLCFISPLVLRVIDTLFAVTAFVSHLLFGAAGAWGFVLASRVFNASTSLAALNTTSTSLAAYYGIHALFFSLFGLWLALAELRAQQLVRTLLRPFAFLHTFVGRGCFSIYVGLSFLFLPWDFEFTWITPGAGGLELAVGLLSILLSVTGLVSDTPTDDGMKAGGSSGGGVTRRNSAKAGSEASRIAWGAPSPAGSGVTEWAGSKSGGDSPAAVEERRAASTSALIASSGGGASAVAPSAPGDGAESAEGGVVSHGNPFLQASAAAAANNS